MYAAVHRSQLARDHNSFRPSPHFYDRKPETVPASFEAPYKEAWSSKNEMTCVSYNFFLRSLSSRRLFQIMSLTY